MQEDVMVRPRIEETDCGITGEFETGAYDEMMRMMRDRGWLETRDLLNNGISSGIALEVGPGPGYLGLEWLKSTSGTRLNGLDISDDMLNIARKNAIEYRLADRVEYYQGDACKMPFEDCSFDAVFTNGSLHEWAHPEQIINEIKRVLIKGGKFVITDLRRDMIFPVKWFMWLFTRPKRMREGLISSINAAYIPDELHKLMKRTNLTEWNIQQNLFGICITGQKV
jgi:ubiquinone/menaquinone biosynthesis C-methylase UbiE